MHGEPLLFRIQFATPVFVYAREIRLRFKRICIVTRIDRRVATLASFPLPSPPPIFFYSLLCLLLYFIISKFVSPVRTTLIEFMVNIMVRVTRSKIEESTKLRGELLYRARDTLAFNYSSRQGVRQGIRNIKISRQCRQRDLSNATLNVIRSVAIV